MTDERLLGAIARLDRALARIETVVGSGGIQPADTAELVRRHERLRERTREAVDALDRLIGKG